MWSYWFDSTLLELRSLTIGSTVYTQINNGGEWIDIEQFLTDHPRLRKYYNTTVES